jgi:hypothetical protein
MHYEKVYRSLIDKANSRTVKGYYETHHIIPRCLGGSDDPSNLVRLTPEEHYVAHQLLTKMYPNHKGLVYAAIMMCVGRSTNKLYGWIRRRLAVVQSSVMKGRKNPTQDKRWVSNEHETILVDKDIAENLISVGTYLYGKKAHIAKCGHLVRNRCIPCENAKEKLRLKKRENAERLARDLYNSFIESNCESVTSFAKSNGTSQPRLTMLWKKYIPEYNNNKEHGVSFKQSILNSDIKENNNN